MRASIKHLSILLVITVSLVGWANDTSEPITISGKASSSEIYIGDQFTYELRVDWEKGYQVLKVEPPLELGRFEILEVKPAKEVSKGGERFSKIYSFVLSTYDIGEFEIPPFTITYKTPSGKVKKALSHPIKIKVKPIPHTAADTHDIRPAKPPIDIPPKPYLRNFLLALALAIIVVGLIGFFVRRYILAKRASAPEEWVPPRPIDELALEELDALANSALLAQGKLKEFYSRASEIIRIYLGRRYHVNAIDLTSYELLRALEGNGIEDSVLKILERFLERCDLVKFAKHRPSDEEHDATLEEARLIVRETTPKPIEAHSPETPPSGRPDAGTGATAVSTAAQGGAGV